MSKTVTIGKRPQAAAPARPSPEAVEKWMQGQGGGAGEPVGGGAASADTATAVPAAPPPKMKRLTIDIPDMLHRRVKSRCSQDGLRMAEVIRDLLEQRFPVS